MRSQLVRQIYPNVPQSAEDDIKRFVDGCLLRHPYQVSTKDQAAIHEAGHFIAFEVEGMTAGMAEIFGTPFGHDGWGGEAKAWNEAPYGQTNGYRDPPTPQDLMSDARVALAGPWTERSLGCGKIRCSSKFCCSISEIIEAHFLSDCVAKIFNLDKH
jgi:hypothetical protein